MLSARSVVASTLLGTTPPLLPGRLLVAFAAEFDIAAGTTRVALSRMVERGELERLDDGVYALAGQLLQRRQRQQGGLEPSLRPWNGDWEIYVVEAGGRTSGDRQSLRRSCLHLGLRELREGVWLRPDNLDVDRLPGARAVVADQTKRFLGQPDDDPAELIRTLFALDQWTVAATELQLKMIEMIDRLAASGHDALVPGFELAAAVLRHLVADPLLPEILWPSGWASAPLRAAYREYDAVYRSELGRFFRAKQTAIA